MLNFSYTRIGGRSFTPAARGTFCIHHPWVHWYWKPTQGYMAQSQVKNLCPEDEGCLSGTSSGHFFACQEGLVDPNKTIRGRMYVELFYGFWTPSSFLLKPKSWLLGLTHVEPVKANSSAWSLPPLSSSLTPQLFLLEQLHMTEAQRKPYVTYLGQECGQVGKQSMLLPNSR